MLYTRTRGAREPVPIVGDVARALYEPAPPRVADRSPGGVQILELRPAGLLDAVPLWEEAVAPGDVGVAVIDGPAVAWNRVGTGSRRARAELSDAPVLTIGVARGAGLSDAAVHVLDGCDVVLCDGVHPRVGRIRWSEAADDTDSTLALVLERIRSVPQPALVSATLLRAGAAVATESLAYSTLLFGAPFLTWRRSTARRPIARDEASGRVRIELRPHIAVIRLTRPARHNAYDARMREALCDALDAVTTAWSGPVVLLGDGPSFCSGGDLDEFGLAEDPVVAHLVRCGRSVARRLQRLSDRLVVGVHGHCIGAGVELASYARFVVAAADATFRLPEATLGLGLGAGGAVGIPRRIGRHRTLELLLRPGSIDADTATAWGLVDTIVPREELEQYCLQLAVSPGRTT